MTARISVLNSFSVVHDFQLLTMRLFSFKSIRTVFSYMQFSSKSIKAANDGHIKKKQILQICKHP